MCPQQFRGGSAFNSPQVSHQLRHSLIVARRFVPKPVIRTEVGRSDPQVLPSSPPIGDFRCHRIQTRSMMHDDGGLAKRSRGSPVKWVTSIAIILEIVCRSRTLFRSPRVLTTTGSNEPQIYRLCMQHESFAMCLARGIRNLSRAINHFHAPRSSRKLR